MRKRVRDVGFIQGWSAEGRVRLCLRRGLWCGRGVWGVFIVLGRGFEEEKHIGIGMGREFEVVVVLR